MSHYGGFPGAPGPWNTPSLVGLNPGALSVASTSAVRGRNPCDVCQALGHTKEQCADDPLHARNIAGARCPHGRLSDLPFDVQQNYRMRALQSTAGSVYGGPGPMSSVSQGSLLQQLAQQLGQPGGAHQPNSNRERLIAEMRAHADFADASQARIEATADALLASRTAQADANLARLVPGVAPPATANAAAPPAFPPAHPGAQILNIPAPPAPPAPQRIESAEVGHVTVTQDATNFLVVHRASYGAAEVQNALAAGQTFSLLDHLDFRWIGVAPIGWRLQIRVIRAAQLPNAPGTQQAFARLGGQLITLDSTRPLIGAETVQLQPADNLAVPIHVVAIAEIMAGGTNNARLVRVAIEVGAIVT